MPSNSDKEAAGVPNERSISAFDSLLRATETSDHSPEEAPVVAPEPVAKPSPTPEPDIPPAPASEIPSIEIKATSPPQAKDDARFAAMTRLIDKGVTGSLTIKLEAGGLGSIGVDLDFLKYTKTESSGDSPTVWRFVLPKSTSIRIWPSDRLELLLGKEPPVIVTYLGDIHDLDDLLPFRIITFLEKPAAAE